MPAQITVSAVIIRNVVGQVLTVRKRGTTLFMFPGGKPELGESPIDAAVREVSEELGVNLDPALLRLVGTFTAPAANEEGKAFKPPYLNIVWFPLVNLWLRSSSCGGLTHQQNYVSLLLCSMTWSSLFCSLSRERFRGWQFSPAQLQAHHLFMSRRQKTSPALLPLQVEPSCMAVDAWV
ncbi:NUDIX hydrolase [Glutamicibacter sp. TV12E]|uniref:NUDIX hydrolase n=1 Tax=Glutamicibacter sp. TV12E TaxID=3446362 RepID=UPI004034CD06